MGLFGVDAYDDIYISTVEIDISFKFHNLFHHIQGQNGNLM